MADESTREFLLDVFREVRGAQVKPMFGGFGIYREGLMFALAADGRVYLKTDEQTRPDFEARGLEPFRYEGKRGVVTIASYHEAPLETLESPQELAPWAARAQAAAVRSAGKKRGSGKPATPKRPQRPRA